MVRYQQKNPQFFCYWFHDTILELDYVSVCGLGNYIFNSWKTALILSVFYHHQ